MNTSSSNARLRPFRPVPFGRYTLLSQLATGGMGEIFLARLEGMQGFEKLCVIKKILPQLAADPEFVERFVGEARTLVKLSHGSIAQVLDMGVHEGEAYMALEYVDGKDLRKVAARARDKQRPLPPGFVLFVMGRVLDALAYAHRKRGDDEGELNLVHRDISPQNILISYEGEVKVIDFGLAKSRLSAAKTNPSIILGKFLYMSPEQARHRPVDRRSDLYAVGLCLYELLSGKNPFELLPPGELMSAVAQPDIAPLSQVMPALPASLAQLVMKALAVEPTQRFQSAEDMRGRLGICLLELEPTAGPESISHSMHELFTSEYLTERRTLVMLRDVGRAPEPEPVVIGMPEGAPPRPVPTLPPKTIRLDGPVEALSFKPTPRTHETGPARDYGETRPAVVVDEATRPAVDMDAIEASRRERMEEPTDFPMPGSVSPTRELQVPPDLPPAPPPAPLADWLAQEEAGQNFEDTPAWSEPLPPPVRAPEPPRSPPPPPREARSFAPPPPPPSLPVAWEDEVPVVQAWEPPPPPVAAPPAYVRAAPPPPLLQEVELPVMSPEELLQESPEVRLEATQPRAQRPTPRISTARGEFPARSPSPDVYHQDTQPRVVLDESLLRDSEQEEVSQSGRSRPVPAAPAPAAAPRVPRRRVTSTGISVVVPSAPARSTASPPRVGIGSSREMRREAPEPENNHEDASETLEPAESREAAGPRGRAAGASRSGRLGWIVSLSLLGVILAVGAGLLFAVLHPERLPPALSERLLPLLGMKKHPTVPHEEEVDPTSASPLPHGKPPSAAAPTPDAAEHPVVPPGPSTAATTPSTTPPVKPTTAPDKPAAPEAALEELSIPSLTSTPETPAPGKRPTPPGHKRAKHSGTFNSEMNRMTRAMSALKGSTVSCEDPKVKIICNRYDAIMDEKDNDDVNETEMVNKMRGVTLDLTKARR